MSVKAVLVLCTFLVSVLLCPIASAAPERYYFNFSLSSSAVREGEEIKVGFAWDIKGFEMEDQKRFRVAVHTSSGLGQLYNGDLNRFISANEAASLAPYLRNQMTLKVLGIQNVEDSIDLEFIIVDDVTGKVYKTPMRKIWGAAYYKKYTSLLNQNLYLYNLDRAEPPAIRSVDLEPPHRNPVNLRLWFFAPAFFLYGLLKLAHGVG